MQQPSFVNSIIRAGRLLYETIPTMNRTPVLDIDTEQLAIKKSSAMDFSSLTVEEGSVSAHPNKG